MLTIADWPNVKHAETGNMPHATTQADWGCTEAQLHDGPVIAIWPS
jgi:hypothetical protein